VLLVLSFLCRESPLCMNPVVVPIPLVDHVGVTNSVGVFARLVVDVCNMWEFSMEGSHTGISVTACINAKSSQVSFIHTLCT
jgi:hypothetical protein